MRGSIRAFLGLVITMAAAGGLDTATDAQLLPCMAMAVVGLAIVASGVNAMREV